MVVPPNGKDYECGFNRFIDDFELIKEQVSENYESMKILTENLQYLRKLDVLEDIKDNLLNAATGSDRVPLVVVVRLIRVLGSLLTAAMGIIIFLLIGNHFNWWSLH